MEIPASVTNGTLQTFLDTANLVCTENLGACGYSTARLTLIELYLAAHLTLLLVERGGLSSSRTGGSEGAQDTYVSAVYSNMRGWMTTRWGQMECTLDPAKVLTNQSSTTLPALFKVMGYARSRDPFLNPDGYGTPYHGGSPVPGLDG